MGEGLTPKAQSNINRKGLEEPRKRKSFSYPERTDAKTRPYFCSDTRADEQSFRFDVKNTVDGSFGTRESERVF